MGLDQSYKTIPSDSPLLKIAVDEPQFGLWLHLIGFSEVAPEEVKRRKDEADFIEYVRLSSEAREQNEMLETRTADIGRHWDMLYYLLSPIRRRCEPEDPDDIACKAIMGGEILGENVICMQGVPIRYLKPEGAEQVFRWLHDLPDDVLHEHWDPPTMCEAGVYKMHATDGETELTYLYEDLQELKDLYALAFAFDEGVLAFCD